MPELFWNGSLEASWAEMASGLPDEVREEAYNNPDGVIVYSPVIEELVEHGFLDADRQWRLHGFKTLSGKVEFDSEELKAQGYDGLPVYKEPAESPLSTPELFKDYPLVLTSGGRQKYFTHSQQHNVPPCYNMTRAHVFKFILAMQRSAVYTRAMQWKLNHLAVK